MQALDLEDEEWEQFASGIAQLAAQRERKPQDFKVFQVGPGRSMLVSINMIIISGACLPAGLQSVPKRAKACLNRGDKHYPCMESSCLVS